MSLLLALNEFETCLNARCSVFRRPQVSISKVQQNVEFQDATLPRRPLHKFAACSAEEHSARSTKVVLTEFCRTQELHTSWPLSPSTLAAEQLNHNDGAIREIRMVFTALLPRDEFSSSEVYINYKNAILLPNALCRTERMINPAIVSRPERLFDKNSREGGYFIEVPKKDKAFFQGALEQNYSHHATYMCALSREITSSLCSWFLLENQSLPFRLFFLLWNYVDATCVVPSAFTPF